MRKKQLVETRTETMLWMIMVGYIILMALLDSFLDVDSYPPEMYSSEFGLLIRRIDLVIGGVSTISVLLFVILYMFVNSSGEAVRVLERCFKISVLFPKVVIVTLAVSAVITMLDVFIMFCFSYFDAAWIFINPVNEFLWFVMILLFVYRR